MALVVKDPPANVGDIRDAGSIPGSRRSPGGGHGSPLSSCLENPHEQRSLVGYGPWGRKELDTTKQLTHTHTQGEQEQKHKEDVSRTDTGERSVVGSGHGEQSLRFQCSAENVSARSMDGPGAKTSPTDRSGRLLVARCAQSAAGSSAECGPGVHALADPISRAARGPEPAALLTAYSLPGGYHIYFPP